MGESDDDDRVLLIEQWTAKLEERRAEFALLRQRAALRGKIGNLIDELAALMSDDCGQRLRARHHPKYVDEHNTVVHAGDYESHWLGTYIRPGVRSQPPEWAWLAEAEEAGLTRPEMAEILDPEGLERNRPDTLAQLRKKFSRLRRAEEDELRKEYEFDEMITKSVATTCKAHGGICDGCPRAPQSEDDFQCGMKWLIARDPDRFSDC